MRVKVFRIPGGMSGHALERVHSVGSAKLTAWITAAAVREEPTPPCAVGWHAKVGVRVPWRGRRWPFTVRRNALQEAKR